MKLQRWVLLVPAVLLALLGSAALAARAERSADVPPDGEHMTTPQLIEAALARGDIDQATADLYLAYALADYTRLPAEYRGAVPWDGTLPLLHLQERVQLMEASAARSELESLLVDTCSSSTGTLTNTNNSSHFYTQYGTIGGGLTLTDYVNALEAAWSTEVITYGWAAPPILTPSGRYHVRIDALGSGLYGYASTSGTYAGLVGDNTNTSWNDVDAYASCLVLNRDYDTGFPGDPLKALQATVAHEFNHGIEFGYGALTGANRPDDALLEGPTTWMEDEVFDASNDNYGFLWPTFGMCMGEYTNDPYAYWITFRGMTERYGTNAAGKGEQIMQNFWELTSKGTGDNLGALNSALTMSGTTLADAYHAYAIAVKFNKTCSGGYVYPYCLEEGPGYVAAAGATAVHHSIATVGISTTGSVPDNYALNWVSLPTSGVYTVTLQNTSAGGQLRVSVVCDTGAALTVNALGVAGGGGSVSLPNFNPSGCTSVVAVITNQNQTANNPSSCTARSYSLFTGNPPEFNERIYLPLVLKLYPFFPLNNGNFESGPTDWTEYSTHGWNLIINSGFPGITPHGGSWAVWLGGDYSDTSYIQQQVTVPPATPYLAYWRWIASAETTCGNDVGSVRANSTAVSTYNLCTSANTGGWAKHVVNLSAYSGQNVMLQIRAVTNGSLNSNLYVDDVAFQASASAVQGDQGQSPLLAHPWATRDGRPY